MIRELAESPYHNPYYEVQGLHESGVWHPLYQYHDGPMARAIMGAILEQDPPECKEYEDFRVVEPEPVPVRGRRGRAEAPRTPQEAPQGVLAKIDPRAVVRTPLRKDLGMTAVCVECGFLIGRQDEAEPVGEFWRHPDCKPETAKRGKRQKAVRV